MTHSKVRLVVLTVCFVAVLGSVVKQTDATTTEQGKLPDAVIALLTQLVLGVAVATSAVPQSVLSVLDRGAETIGVLIVLVVTAISAAPLRSNYGQGDLASSEYLLVVLTPLVTRVDLGLLIWVSVNKALIWAEPMLYATREELMATELLRMASMVWHNGENHIRDVEFGQVGGEAAVLMHQLHHLYHPRNAGANVLLWLGHLTLWPIALLFHGILQIISTVGFAVFYFVAHTTHEFASWGSKSDNLVQRGSFLGFVLRREEAQSRKLFMMREAATLFDSSQNLMRFDKRVLRQMWSMIATVDAMVQNQHYAKVFDIMYPMRAPLVLQRALASNAVRELTVILNKKQVFFKQLPDAPIVNIGEKGSRQIVLYRLFAWPPYSQYAADCMQNLRNFVDENMSYWKKTESLLRLEVDRDAAAWSNVKSEFISVRDIVRRLLVQLIILAFCDGMGECYLSGESNVSGDLAKAYLQPNYMGLEMAMRLASANPQWLDEHARESNRNMLATISVFLDDCACEICQEVNKSRRIPNTRYMAQPNVAQLREQLEQVGCSNAGNISRGLEKAVNAWTSAIFEPKEEK